MTTLTDNEKTIVDILRSLQPFEEITVVADKAGKPNNFLIKRSRKAILTDQGIIYVSV